MHKVGPSCATVIWDCKLFSQWRHSFQMKAVLPLAKRLVTWHHIRKPLSYKTWHMVSSLSPGYSKFKSKSIAWLQQIQIQLHYSLATPVQGCFLLHIPNPSRMEDGGKNDVTRRLGLLPQLAKPKSPGFRETMRDINKQGNIKKQGDMRLQVGSQARCRGPRWGMLFNCMKLKAWIYNAA